ncbi:hypothetical protein ZHAS_00016778 [Anopheles sinensis]|uniref:Uncharacterized protein n=1 Tax=Anopheles sinensis TaxID=74873 RepID=A0A084WEX6_ANOSI|nr:hypothetical protein ZHAS_00016778 [Anopheles sinensis]
MMAIIMCDGYENLLHPLISPGSLKRASIPDDVDDHGMGRPDANLELSLKVEERQTIRSVIGTNMKLSPPLQMASVRAVEVEGKSTNEGNIFPNFTHHWPELRGVLSQR